MRVWSRTGLSLVALSLAAMPALAFAPTRAGADSPRPAVNLGAMRGNGELAIVEAGRLYLAGGAARDLRAVSGAGTVSFPEWSHDGRWLAYTRTPAGSQSSQLWVVRSNGTDNHRVPIGTAAGLYVAGTAQESVWSPGADILATSATTKDGGPGGLWVASPGAGTFTVRTPGGKRLRTAGPVDLVPDGTGPVWSPNGRALAYTRTLPSANPVNRSDALYTRALTGAPARHLVARRAGILIASWWPKGHGLLYWIDPLHSASLAADGLGLYTMDLGTGRRELLAATLVGSPSFSWGPNDLVAVAAGSGREGWTGKALLRCAARIPAEAAQACVTVVPPGGPVSFDPAWSTAGLAFVRAGDLGSQGWGRSTSKFDAWRATRTLWLMPTGGAPRAIRGAGGGVYDPVWSADARELMVVRGTSAYLVDPARGTAVQVASGIRPYLYPMGYYGRLDEARVLAWYSGPN